MTAQNTGTITQVIGAVLDIRFSKGVLPEINDAVTIEKKDGGRLTAEVAQHLGDDVVRCIAMGPRTDWSGDGSRRIRRADYRAGGRDYSGTDLQCLGGTH